MFLPIKIIVIYQNLNFLVAFLCFHLVFEVFFGVWTFAIGKRKTSSYFSSVIVLSEFNTSRIFELRIKDSTTTVFSFIVQVIIKIFKMMARLA